MSAKPPTEEEKNFLVACFAHTQDAQRRLWEARDTVDRLRRELANAEMRLKQAAREAEKSAGQTRNYWAYFREAVESIPIVAADESEVRA